MNAFLVDQVTGLGAAGVTDLSYRVQADEYGAYTFYRGDAIVFEWTNPDTTDLQRWDLEVGLAPVPDA